MPTFNVTAPNGKTYQVTGPEGSTQEQAIAQVQSMLGQQPAAPQEPGSLPGDIDGVPSMEANVPESRGNPTGGENELLRALGLSGRAAVGAIPKTAAGLGDLVAMVGDKGLELAGSDMRMGGGRVEVVDDLLNNVFPEPRGMMERAGQLGAEALATGGAGGIAAAGRLLPRVSSLVAKDAPQHYARAPQVGSFLDDIGEFALTRPGTALATEAAGGAGASIGGDLGADAELGPGGQLVTSILGGIAAPLAPAVAQRSLSAVGRFAEPITPTGGERRAARELQARSADPEADAAAARNAPEGVSGARASGDRNLMATENRVLTDDPQMGDASELARLDAEARAIDSFTAGAAPGQTPDDWQRAVVSAAAPEGTVITGTQPDEMLDEAFQAFRGRYAELDDYPVQTQVMNVEGGNVEMPEAVAAALMDESILASEGARQGLMKWAGALLKDVSRRGTPITKRDDERVVEFMSQDMLDLRQAVRKKQRQLQKTGATNVDAASQAELLDNVDAAITEALESQLPDAASQSLRALDSKYADFKTVEGASLRGKPNTLSANDLAQEVKQRTSSSRAARGDTGTLGTLAEQGNDVTKALGKNGTQDQIVARTVRNMTPEQAQGVRGDMTRELARRGSKPDLESGDPKLDGRKLMGELEKNRSTLIAAGFEPADLTRLEQIARRLTMIQSKSPTAATELMDDGLSVIGGLASRVAGAKVAKNVTKKTGTGGPGVLALTGFLSRNFERTFGSAAASRAQQMIRDAMQPTPEGRELFAALLTRDTDKELKRLQSRRILNAWMAQTAAEDTTEQE